jgi:hypothetical protein
MAKLDESRCIFSDITLRDYSCEIVSVISILLKLKMFLVVSKVLK